jgi:hypothetical protein
MEPNGWLIQGELLPGTTIIGHDVTGTMNTDEELVQGAMGVLAPNLLARNTEYQEIPLHWKGNMETRFAKTQISPEILDARHPM